MSFLASVKSQLSAQPIGGYQMDGAPASEPTALACLALASAGQFDSAMRAGDWLIAMQRSDGGVGVTPELDSPRWPTSLCILAWLGLYDRTGQGRFAEAADRALRALLQLKGTSSEPSEDVSHDVTLIGWAWVNGTHSWLEPTAMAVLAMKRAGRAHHPRAIEAMKILRDRQLPVGGYNYGNTVVLRQELLPHLQPTGLVLMTISDERASSWIARCTTWLESEWPHAVGLPSICYAAQGLTASVGMPGDCHEVLQRNWDRLTQGCEVKKVSTYNAALMLLAMQEASDNLLLPSAWPASQRGQPNLVDPARDGGPTVSMQGSTSIPGSNV